MLTERPVECPPAHSECARAAAARSAHQNLLPYARARSRRPQRARARTQKANCRTLTVWNHVQAPEDSMGPSVSAQHEAEDLLEQKQQELLREAREQRKASRAR